MIRFSDAMLLASTKLRARKLRTIVTAIMASLMFASIVFAFAVQRGVIDSYAAFTDNGLSEKFIAEVYFGDSLLEEDFTSSSLIASAKEKQKARIAEKTAAARELGIDYDPSGEVDVTTKKDSDTGEVYLNTDSIAARQAIAEQRADQPSDIERIQKLSAPYNPTKLHTFRSAGDTSGLTVMPDGRESFGREDKSDAMVTGQSLGQIDSLSYLTLDLAEAYMLEGADRTVANSRDDAIPVIVPFSRAETALGLKPLDSRTATSQQKLERLDEVKRRAANAAIDVCYRNGASRQLIESVHHQQQEAKRSEAKPQVEYALPDETSCGPVAIAADGRSAEEREYEEKLAQFQQRFDEEVAPQQAKLRLRIVGISPDPPNWESISTLQSIVMMFGGSNLNGRWVIPDELVSSKLRDSLIPQGSSDASMPANYWSQAETLVEFGSADDVRRFSENESCNGWSCGSGAPLISYFGSSSVLIEDASRKVVEVMKWVVLAVAIIAAILMMGMAGRVITDSRRETAVFRAIGARRNDIRLIYVIYIVLFSLIVVGFALLLGLVGAWALSAWQTESLTTAARLMFIESNYTGQYRLVGIWPMAFAAVAGTIILTGLVAILLPLARNMVRSPLRDMRDE